MTGDALRMPASVRAGQDAALDFQLIVERAQIGIGITCDGSFVYVNPMFAQLHGYECDALIGAHFSLLIPPQSLERVSQVRRRRDAGQRQSAYNTQGQRRDGTVFDTRVFACVIEFRGRPAHLVTLSDITDRVAADAQIERLLNYHPVSGLATRAALLKRSDAAISVAAATERPVAMLHLRVGDVDRVHDTLGMAAGDMLAKLLADRIQAGCRDGDVAAHLGGGEFALLLGGAGGADEAEALGTAMRLLAALGESTLVDGTEVLASGKIGIALFPKDAADSHELLARAHAASGGVDGSVGFFTAEVGERAARSIKLESALRKAFERRELSLHYQPQLDLRDGSIVGAEALLRWHSEQFGHVSPAEFVPIAERCGLIVEMGEWVFRTACEQSVKWNRAGLPPLRIAVNLSPRQLEQPDISRRLQTVLLETGADPEQLGIEVTESILMNDLEAARRTLNELSAIGIEISLDDFGTGYSNIAVLRALPFNVLKIDRSLVHDVTAAPEDVSITRAVLSLAQGLKIKVLAEGVETEGQLNLLIANGCDFMQGFIFSRPLTAQAMEQMLREDKRLPEHFLNRPQKRRTLLLVDDEENILWSLNRLLRGEGYRIITATSGTEGLARLAEHDVDVIVSDQRMPGMTGIEFLRRAKEMYPATVRIMLSGYTELQSVTDAVNEGAIYKFFTKPWDDESLRSQIAEAFRMKELHDESERVAADVRHANVELEKTNERQDHLLVRQQELINFEASRALNAQVMLENLPTAVIGIDLDGEVAFANRQARRLMGGMQAWIGMGAEEALPLEWLEARERPDGKPVRIDVAGADYLLSCNVMNGGDFIPRGHLLSIVPNIEAKAFDKADS